MQLVAHAERVRHGKDSAISLGCWIMNVCSGEVAVVQPDHAAFIVAATTDKD